jgi:hypothetical protein
MKDAVPINKYYCCLRDVFSLFSKKIFSNFFYLKLFSSHVLLFGTVSRKPSTHYTACLYLLYSCYEMIVNEL